MKMNSHKSLLKKLSLIAFIMILMAVNITSYAQEESDEAATEESEEAEDAPKEKSAFFDKLQWGPKVGLTMSTFYSAHDENIAEYRPGFVGGVSFMYPVTNLVDLGFELLYANQGANNVGVQYMYPYNFETIPKEEMDVRLQTLELPVLVTVDLTTQANPTVIPQLILGHSFGLNLMAETNSTFVPQGDESREFKGSNDVTERVQAQNFALIGGLGFEILKTRGPKIEPLSFNLDFTYKFGYSDMSNIPLPQNAPEGFTNDYNNNRLEISLRMKF